MKSRSLFSGVVLLLIGLLLGACSLPTFGTSGYTSKIIYPPSGGIFSLGSEINVIGGTDYGVSQPPVTSLTFWGNGMRLGAPVSSLETTPYGTNAQTIGRQSWTPPSAGEYQVQVQATISDGRISISPPVRICVLDFVLPHLDLGSDSGSGGYTGPCHLPPAPAFSPQSNTVSIVGQATPASLVFSNTNPICAPSVSPTITFQASANDLGSRIALVTAIYDVSVPGVGGGTESIVLNQSSGLTPPTRTFSGTTPNIEGILANLQDASGNAISGDLVWTIHAYGRDGALLASDGPHTIPAAPAICTGSPTVMPHVIQPFPTDTPAPNDLIANVQAYPSPIYYGQTCPTLSTIAFRTALKLPNGTAANQIQTFAHVGVSGTGGSPAGNLLIPLLPNGTFDTASGGQVFLGSLSLDHSYHDANNQFDPAVLGGNSGILNWYVTVSSNNSSGQSVELARSPDQTTNLAPCPTYAKPTSKPPLPSSGNSCNLSQPACSLKGLKFDPSSCSCVP
jgi:hypothetical protein